MKNHPLYGHALALLTVLLWGTTFVSIKVLLRSMTPAEILLLRFSIGILALFAVWPHRLKLQKRTHEWLFAGAGLTGVAIYYLFENIALQYGSASNVSVIASTAPLFTAFIAARIGCYRLRASFFIGFAVALCGIAQISFSGEARVSPVGDLLALVAAIAWGVYSLFTRRIEELGYPTIPATRRIFIYGVLLMLLPVQMLGFHPTAAVLLTPVNLWNLAFLSFGAGALCFVTWNRVTGILGAVEASVYIYLTPVVTVFTAAIVLGERLTLRTFSGIALVIVGLLLSEGQFSRMINFKREMEHGGTQ